LGRAFSEAADGSPLARAKAGSLPVMMEVVERSEAMLAVEFAKEHGLVGALVGLRRADGAVEAIAASGLGVVFEPAGVGASRTTLMSARLLHEAGVPIAFTADAESRGAAALRMAAAAYVRAGLGSEAALQAMTHGAAEIAGVSGSHGTIAAGKVAELVVWSGAPTDLTSRVLHVFAGGEHVYDAQAHGGQEAR
ncbi:MAG: amidohydrolase family protein, partial [Planctomycetota bacterium]